METIQYATDRRIDAERFIDLLRRSTLGERRPINEPETIRSMLEHADILVTAWDGQRLVGVSRAVSDFAYCTYLSDLAVDIDYQRRGIGKELIRRTQQIGGRAALILLAAPAAEGYYPRIGMTPHHSCWMYTRQ